MAEESFKERARQEMIKAAKQYKDIYVDYEYLICSVTFEKNAKACIYAGFRHLFYQKALVWLYLWEQ